MYIKLSNLYITPFLVVIFSTQIYNQNISTLISKMLMTEAKQVVAH